MNRSALTAVLMAAVPVLAMGLAAVGAHIEFAGAFIIGYGLVCSAVITVFAVGAFRPDLTLVRFLFMLSALFGIFQTRSSIRDALLSGRGAQTSCTVLDTASRPPRMVGPMLTSREYEYDLLCDGGPVTELVTLERVARAGEHIEIVYDTAGFIDPIVAVTLTSGRSALLIAVALISSSVGLQVFHDALSPRVRRIVTLPGRVLGRFLTWRWERRRNRRGRSSGSDSR